MEVVTFKNIGYPVRTVCHRGGDFKVAEKSLSDALLDTEDLPINDEAEEIDNSIAYYCTHREFTLSDEELFLLVYGDEL